MDSVDWRLWSILGAGVAASGVVLTGIYYYSFRRGFSRNPNRLQGKSYKNPENPEAQYMMEHNLEHPVLKRLREYTITLTNGDLVTPSEQGTLLTILCKAIGASKVIDVGVFTGCSSFAMALGLPPGGKVVACDVTMEYPKLGQPYWDEGGMASKIDLRIKPATETLQELLDKGEGGSYDLIFIDADKQNYPRYYELGLELLCIGGLIVVDNALAIGEDVVYDVNNFTEELQAIRSMNWAMKEDQRVDYTLLNVGEGVGIAYKKK